MNQTDIALEEVFDRGVDLLQPGHEALLKGSDLALMLSLLVVLDEQVGKGGDGGQTDNGRDGDDERLFGRWGDHVKFVLYCGVEEMGERSEMLLLDFWEGGRLFFSLCPLWKFIFLTCQKNNLASFIPCPWS